jgi:FtsP/CotA-like multicopper oxidase with cupredoxin domain
VQAFCDRYGLRVPILQAPMARACPPELAVAVAEAGGMGGAGVLLDQPDQIAEWMRRFRAGSAGAVQLNIWIPDSPDDDQARVDAAAAFLSRFGTPAPAGSPGPDFGEQSEAMLAARPTVVSSIMGLFEPGYVQRLHDHGIVWFACATTLKEALAAQDAGADAIVAQGMEAGGHRGGFDPDAADRTFDYSIGRRPGFVQGKPGIWWTINGHMWPDVPMFTVAEGDVVRMEIDNHSGEVHPMHLHGHHAVVLSRDGVEASGSPWWVDSLNVRDGERYEIAFVADNPGIWMDHCHNLNHARGGFVLHLTYAGVGTRFQVGPGTGNDPE